MVGAGRTETGTAVRPPDCTSWMWLHPDYLDRELWQDCLVRAYASCVADPVGTAQFNYSHRGGRCKTYIPRKQRKKATPPQATPEELLGAIAAVKPDHKDDVVVVVEIDRTIWDAMQQFKGRGR